MRFGGFTYCLAHWVDENTGMDSLRVLGARPEIKVLRGHTSSEGSGLLPPGGCVFLAYGSIAPISVSSLHSLPLSYVSGLFSLFFKNNF